MKTSLYPTQPLLAPLPCSHGLYFCIATQKSLPLSKLPHLSRPHQSLQQDSRPELMSLLICDIFHSTRILQKLTIPSGEEGGGWGPSFLQD